MTEKNECRILLIEDNAGDVRLIREMLADAQGWSFDVVCAEQLATGIRCLAEDGIDLVLLDLSLPGSRGLETFFAVQEQAPSLPIVVLTGLDDEVVAVKAVREGAQDYLVKGQVSSPLLSRALRYAMERKQAELAREELLAAEHEQRVMAETLMEVTRVLNTTLQQESVLQLILEQLALVVNYDSASVMQLFDTRFSTVAQRGFRSPQQGFNAVSLKNLAHMHEVVARRRPVIIPDTAKDTRWLCRPESAHVRCWLGVPLVVKDRVIGVLNLDREEPGFYGPRHAEIAAAFANQAAIAMENARLYEDLQRRMQELKHTHGQLIQSAKLAAVGTLAAGVAHELNNPLQAVLGFGELLLKTAEPGSQNVRDLEVIVEEARRARDIVRGLLEFARQTESYEQSADVNQVIQDTLALLRRHLRTQGIALGESYARDLPPVELDVGRMKQVLVNLLNNAAQAMPDGGNLTVSSEEVEDHVVIHITDTGSGISPEALPHIFEPFYTTKPVGQGTGLGLSVSLGIVQDHDGRIEVQSRLGEGSTFSIWLPAVGDPERDIGAGEGEGQIKPEAARG